MVSDEEREKFLRGKGEISDTLHGIEGAVGGTGSVLQTGEASHDYQEQWAKSAYLGPAEPNDDGLQSEGNSGADCNNLNDDLGMSVSPPLMRQKSLRP